VEIIDDVEDEDSGEDKKEAETDAQTKVLLGVSAGEILDAGSV